MLEDNKFPLLLPVISSLGFLIANDLSCKGEVSKITNSFLREYLQSNRTFQDVDIDFYEEQLRKNVFLGYLYPDYERSLVKKIGIYAVYFAQIKNQLNLQGFLINSISALYKDYLIYPGDIIKFEQFSLEKPIFYVPLFLYVVNSIVKTYDLFERILNLTFDVPFVDEKELCRFLDM
ncbi:MAG: hypothetical protein QXX30_00050 [Candidatus Aenigmatarchaeota archaeon]